MTFYYGFLRWISSWLECIKYKFYTNDDDDNSRRPFNYWMMINMSTSIFNDGMKSAKEADHLPSWAPLRWVHCYKRCFCKDIHLCMGMWQQTLQAGLSIREGLTAQAYIDEIVRTHVKPHIDSHALADSTVCMRGRAKPQTARVSQDILANANNILLSAKNPDIGTNGNVWSIMSRNTVDMSQLP